MLKDKKNPNESVQRTRILVKNKKIYFEFFIIFTVINKLLSDMNYLTFCVHMLM